MESAPALSSSTPIESPPASQPSAQTSTSQAKPQTKPLAKAHQSLPKRQLWVSLHFHRLAIEVSGSADLPTPAIVIDTHSRYPVIVCANHAAERAGAFAGMPLSVAHSLCGQLEVHVQHQAAEQARIEFLAAVASRFTANVSIDLPDILLLEINASLRLFGGLKSLLRQLHADIEQQGHQTHSAAGPTASAAALLSTAYFSMANDSSFHTPVELPNTLVVTSHQRALALIRDMPVHQLARHVDLTDKQYRTLIGMGLRDIKDLLRMPRDGLARRISPNLIHYLDKLAGKQPESRLFYLPPTRFSLQQHLDEPVTDIELLINVANNMLKALVDGLNIRCAGISRLKWTFRHRKIRPTMVVLNLTEAVRDHDHLVAVVGERFERIRFNQPVEGVALHTSAFVFKHQDNMDLFLGKTVFSTEANGEFLDRLRSRLGDGAVSGLSLISEHRPENAWAACRPLDGACAHQSPEEPQRPLWLLSQPKKLKVIDAIPQLNGALILCHDRERIESGWWDGVKVLRDYYVAQNRAGTRVWIYRDLSQKKSANWYLHGVFA